MIDGAQGKVVVAGGEVPLTPKEFDVLALLAAADGAVCSRRRIALEV